MRFKPKTSLTLVRSATHSIAKAGEIVLKKIIKIMTWMNYKNSYYSV